MCSRHKTGFELRRGQVNAIIQGHFKVVGISCGIAPAGIGIRTYLFIFGKEKCKHGANTVHNSWKIKIGQAFLDAIAQTSRFFFEHFVKAIGFVQNFQSGESG